METIGASIPQYSESAIVAGRYKWNKSTVGQRAEQAIMWTIQAMRAIRSQGMCNPKVTIDSKARIFTVPTV